MRMGDPIRGELRTRAGNAWVAVPFLLVLAACSSTSGATPQPADTRIEAALEGWFTALARSGAAPFSDAASPVHFARTVDLDFVLRPDSALTPASFDDWLASLRTIHPRVSYRIAAITIEPMEQRALRVRFVLERDAIDVDALRHVARSEQTWRIELKPSGPLEVSAVSEVPKLVFPGTGPQIVCY